METVVLVIHLIVAIAIIALVLLQRSEGGGLGIGGGGMGNFASARGTANALTRLTAFCAMIFFATSLTLGVLASRGKAVEKGILEKVDVKDVDLPAPQAPVEGAGGVTYVPPEEAMQNEDGVAPSGEEIPVSEDVSTEPAKVEGEQKTEVVPVETEAEPAPVSETKKPE